MLKASVCGIASNSIVIYCIVMPSRFYFHLADCNNKCNILSGHCVACHCVCHKCTVVHFIQINCGLNIIIVLF